MPANIESTAHIPLQIAASNISSIDIPFLINFSNPEFDKIVIFIVAVLLAVTVNAEGQAFAATVLGDIKKDTEDRFHFNPFLHINLAGLICFAVAGFGWSKQITISEDKFKNPALALFIVKFAGIFSNLLLASIAGSIIFIMKKWNLEDQVFSIVISVNIMIFVYNCIPVPPLAGAYFIYAIISIFLPIKNRLPKERPAYRVIPYIFAATLIVIKINGWTFLDDTLNPVVKYIFHFIAG